MLSATKTKSRIKQAEASSQKVKKEGIYLPIRILDARGNRIEFRRFRGIQKIVQIR